jgi:hypothetical protein
MRIQVMIIAGSTARHPMAWWLGRPGAARKMHIRGNSRVTVPTGSGSPRAGFVPGASVMNTLGHDCDYYFKDIMDQII